MREDRPLYADRRLAALYDAINPPGPDYDFYVDLAEPAPKRLLDMGCGTGRLACAWAARGHRVTGAEPATAMLAQARAKAEGAGVEWVAAGAADLDLEARFDLIVMTGHVFQVFMSDAEIRAVLATLRRHLAPAGRLAFETRNPARREWESWTPESSREALTVEGLGSVEVHWDLRSVEGEEVVYETHVLLADGQRLMQADRLRFIERAPLETLLRDSGFGRLTWYGDWDRSALTPSSPEIVVVAA